MVDGSRRQDLAEPPACLHVALLHGGGQVLHRTGPALDVLGLGFRV